MRHVDFGAAIAPPDIPEPPGGIEFAGAAKAQPTATGPLDLEPVKGMLTHRYRPLLDQMFREARALEVTSDGREAEAVALAGKAKKLKNDLDKKRKEVTKDARDFTSAVNRLVKDFTEALGRIEAELKGKIAAYRRQKELERRKAEAAARKAMAETQKRLEAEAKAAGVEAVKLPEPVMPEPPKVTRTESGAAHVQKRWAFRVVDLAQVPREYLMLDTRAVNAAIRAGVREIPGLEIYQEEKVVIRT